MMRTTDTQIREELKQLGRHWDKAIADNDAFEIGRFMADDWVMVGTEGGIISKSNFIEHVKSGDLQHHMMDFEDIRVNVYENTGIVTSKGTSSGTFKGQPFSYYEWSTNVYIKNGEQWLSVHTMLTPAER